MPDNQVIQTFWPIFLTLIFIIIWAVRLEAKNKSCQDNLKRQDDEIKEIKNKMEYEHSKIDAKFETVAIALTGIKESLARIEGRLSNKGDCPIN